MNIESLKKVKESLDDRSKGGGFLSQRDIKGEMVVRLLPEPAVLDGMFHVEVSKYWLAGKPIICQSTFGKKSVIQEEIDEAKTSDDEDLVALASNTENKTGVSLKKEVWMALLQLEYKLAKDQSIESAIVVDGKAKVFACGPMLLSDMIKAVTSRKAIQNAKGSKLYAADPVTGTNIILSRTGTTKNDTKYAAALDECMEMEAKYYVDIPNVYEIAKSQCSNASFQRATIRQYLYGEPIPAEVAAKEGKRAEAAKAALNIHTAAPADEDAPKKKKVVAEEEEAPVAKKKKTVIVDEDEDETPAPKKAAKKAIIEDEDDEDTPPVKAVAKKKAIIEEDEDEDEAPAKPVAKKKAIVPDEEDEDEPVAKPKKKAVVLGEDEDDLPIPKKSAAKKSIIEDEDEDDAPAPVIKKKSAIPPPPPAKKAVAKKSILDDIDDLDED